MPLPRRCTDRRGRVRRLVLDGAVAARATPTSASRPSTASRSERTSSGDELTSWSGSGSPTSANTALPSGSWRRNWPRHASRPAPTPRPPGTSSSCSVTSGRSTIAYVGLDEGLRPSIDTLLDAAADGPSKRFLKKVVGRARRVLRPGKRVLARAEREVSRRGRAQVHRLPPDAQRALRVARRAIDDGPKAVAPQLRAAARRLPPPAERMLRRGVTVARRLRAAQGAGSPSYRSERPVVEPRSAPKGPAPSGWREGYERLVASAVPAGSHWLVVQPGSPRFVATQGPGGATPFPTPARGTPLTDDLSFVAQLEALRVHGYDRLVVPEGSRPWLHHHQDLREHVISNWPALADEENAGLVFDLSAAARSDTSSVRAAVTRLAGLEAVDVSVLDWTTYDVRGELNDVASFRPPTDEGLPYLDGTIDVVVVDGSRDLSKARRVASRGVVVVDRNGAGSFEVVDIHRVAHDDAVAAPHVLVWTWDPEDDPRWRAALEERVSASGADLHLAPLDATGLQEVVAHDVVVVLEPYVLPLPGVINTASQYVVDEPGAILSGKVIGADGALESAGGTVFADRSVALIGHRLRRRARAVARLRPAGVLVAGLIAVIDASVWNATSHPRPGAGRCVPPRVVRRGLGAGPRRAAPPRRRRGAGRRARAANRPSRSRSRRGSGCSTCAPHVRAS